MNDMAKPRIETGTPLLVAKDLVVGYPDDGIYTKPINGASLSIGAREVVGLIGDARQRQVHPGAVPDGDWRGGRARSLAAVSNSTVATS